MLIELDNLKPHIVKHFQRLYQAFILPASIDHAGPRDEALRISYAGEQHAHFSKPPASTMLLK
jgi:hypothetical protein